MGVGALGRRAWGARQGRAVGVARGRQGARAAGARAAGTRARGACAAGRAGRAAGALLSVRSSRGTGAVRAAMHGLGVAGRLGWPWAVHSVHLAHFRSVLTRFFSLSHQMNTVHCKVNFFRKKNKIIFIKFK